MSLYRPFGLIGLDGRAATLLDQKTGNKQRLVANHFSRQSQTRAARQQSILGIALQQLAESLSNSGGKCAHRQWS